jgi:hypothetical protein
VHTSEDRTNPKKHNQSDNMSEPKTILADTNERADSHSRYWFRQRQISSRQSVKERQQRVTIVPKPYNNATCIR